KDAARDRRSAQCGDYRRRQIAGDDRSTCQIRKRACRRKSSTIRRHAQDRDRTMGPSGEGFRFRRRRMIDLNDNRINTTGRPTMRRANIFSTLLFSVACLALVVGTPSEVRSQTATVYEGARLITGDGAVIENSGIL